MSIVSCYNIPIKNNQVLESISTLSIDMDSTLIFTNKANFLAYKEAVFSICALTIKENYSGRFDRYKLKTLLPNETNDTIYKIIHLKKKIYKKYLYLTKPNNELIYFLNNQKNKKIILNTNASKERGYKLLKYHNLLNLFHKILYNKQDNKYKNLLNLFHLRPKEILVFEDEQKEITKALQVGIPIDNIIKIGEIND